MVRQQVSHPPTSVSGAIVLYDITSSSGGAGNPPNAITTGPDGAVWFTQLAGTIGRLATDGTLTEYTLPDPAFYTMGIAAGPDGNLWFCDTSSRISRLAPDGTLTRYSVRSVGDTIVAGADGAMWFSTGPGVGRISTSGQVSYIDLGAPAPVSLTVGPDGKVWYSSASIPVGSIAANGTVTTFPPQGWAIAAGPDGNLWLATGDPVSSPQLWKMTTTGVVLGKYPIPRPQTYRWSLAAGPDGNMWIASAGTNGTGSLIKVAPDGAVTIVGPDDLNVVGVTAGPDGNVWYTESSPTLLQVGKVVLH